MSVMCKMGNACCATKGMCSHEKMAMIIIGVIAAGAIGHWVLGLF